MQLLFDEKLAPITSTIGFLEVPREIAVDAFHRWHRKIYEPLGNWPSRRSVTGTLEHVLLSLLPLTSVWRPRSLFIPTDSPWTAFVDNGHQGTDAFPPMSYLAERLGCRGMRVTAVPDTIEGEFRGARGHYGGVVWEVYGPEATHFLNYVRSISAVNDGGRWDFHQSGTPFPFEEIDRYRARRVRDRFTVEMLARYLAALGMRPFDEDFYLPGSLTAELIELHGPQPPASREFSLAEAQECY